MTKRLMALALGVVVAMTARFGFAEPKAHKVAKPSVCVDFEVAEIKGGRIGVCYDGKKPAVYNMFTIVDVNAGDAESPTKTVRVMVGWR